MPRPKKKTPNRADGLYEVKITLGKDIQGKLIRQSFYSNTSKEDARKKADEWRIEQEVARRAADSFISRDVTFERWARQWLCVYKKPHVDENTYLLSYENTVEKHLIPFFGSSKLSCIKPMDIAAFYATKTDLSESMLKKMKMCLNGIFLSAIDNDLCLKNPAREARFSTETKKHEKKIYTEQDIEKVESYARDRMPDVLILLETGLRRGELLGLKWEDLDFINMSLTVRRSMALSEGGVKENPPKWQSFRVNPLSSLAADMLVCIKPATASPNAYIFPLEDGRPQSPNTWSQKLRRFMGEMTATLSIPSLTAHELRHTYGTSLRRRGVDIYTIQKIMGHKDIKMTSEIYVHNELEMLRRALDGAAGKEK